VVAIFSSWPRADVEAGPYGWVATFDLVDALIAKFGH
jgi:hypothetical protein